MVKRLGEMGRAFVAWWSVGKVGLALAILGIVATLTGHLDQYGAFSFRDLFHDLYANLGTELMSIAITVLIIDALAERREEARRAAREAVKAEAELASKKEGLLRQLGSSMNRDAKRAAERLRAEGWLEDGSLVAARLTGANLQGADLRHANLAAARLFRANLQGAGLYKANLEKAQLRAANLREARLGSANLRYANLSGANLEGAYMAGAWLEGADLLRVKLMGVRGLAETRLAGVRRLLGATLPDGTRYDGRYELAGDLEMAERDGVDTGDADAMAAWYADEASGRKRTKKAPKSGAKK